MKKLMYYGLAVITVCIGIMIIVVSVDWKIIYQLIKEYPYLLVAVISLGASVIAAMIKNKGIKRRYGVEHGSGQVKNPSYLSDLKDKKHYNFILSENVRISFDGYKTKRNNNVVVVGGSGAGKNKHFIEPNLLEANQNYVMIDPKGATYELTKQYLEKEGYTVRCLNFVDPSQSQRYNPLNYITKETDFAFISKILASIQEEKKNNTQNPFWDNTARLLIEIILYYVYYVDETKTLNRFFDLFNDYKANMTNSELVFRMSELSESSDERLRRIATDFKGVNEIVGETLSTSLADTAGRLQNFRYDDVRSILDGDDLDFTTLGTKEKQALFIIIPDNGDTTYNFLISIFYNQFFIKMYEVANQYPGKRLPCACTVIMDEFKNIKLPKNFNAILSTIRSRNMGIWIILQGLSQLKELYKDSWEQVMANCGYFLYLGTDEQETHKYLSTMIGSETIEKRSYSGGGFLSRGKVNFDTMKREIYTPDEIKRLSSEDCFVFVSGKYPVKDKKVIVFEGKKIIHPKFKRAFKLMDNEFGEELKHLLIELKTTSISHKKIIDKYDFLFTSSELSSLKKLSREELVIKLEEQSGSTMV